MSIDEFIGRCDRYVGAASVSRVWLSKKLFNDTYRLDHLADGSTDIGVKRLQRAVRDLAALEATLPGGKPPRHTARSAA